MTQFQQVISGNASCNFGRGTIRFCLARFSSLPNINQKCCDLLVSFLLSLATSWSSFTCQVLIMGFVYISVVGRIIVGKIYETK